MIRDAGTVERLERHLRILELKMARALGINVATQENRKVIECIQLGRPLRKAESQKGRFR